MTNMIQHQPTQIMLRFISLLLLGVFISVLHSCGESAVNSTTTMDATEANEPSQQRIVSLSGTITELLYYLNVEEELVGVDITSVYPEAATQLPKLGHVSQLNTEALLQLKPTVVLVDKEQQEQEALQQLTAAGVKVVGLTFSQNLDNAVGLAKQLQVPLPITQAQIAALEQQLTADRVVLERSLAAMDGQAKPKVLFLYARGTNRLMVAGTDTTAEAMIEAAGGQNAITDFSDFQALTPEALVAAAPEVILMFTSGLASLDGVEGLSQVPGIAQTPAYRNKRVIAMDGAYLLGFGPRAVEAATELAKQLHNPKEI